MKILEKIEADNIPVWGKIQENPIIQELKKLEVGQALQVSVDEWKPKSQIGVIVSGSFRKERSEKKFSIRKISDGTGWLIYRTA